MSPSRRVPQIPYGPPLRRAGRPRRRLIATLIVLTLLFALVVGRLAQLQIVAGDRFVELGESQRVRPVELPAQRGTLFDRNGRDLALSIDQRTVWADPRLVTDPAGSAAALAPLLSLDPAALESKLRSASAFEYLARQVPDDVADRVSELALPGIAFLDEPKRFNPSGDLARSVLGSVTIDSVGSAGLELQYDDMLTGAPGELVLERDPDGRTIPAGVHQLRPAERGRDLVLTIDQVLQFEAERLLAQQVDAMGGQAGMIVVTEPGTGEILAMATVESPGDGNPSRPSGHNRALTTVFEPGSANKVITLAAALEENIVDPDTPLSVPDHLPVADHVFRDHDPHPISTWTPTDIMATSSNIGTIMLGQELGPERLDGYMRDFGFGDRTALDFPNESAGLLLPLERWSGTSIGSIPIGQGIAVTALQMLAAYNVIANGGEYVAPKLVKATVDVDGTVHPTGPSERRRVVSEETAGQVRDMLVEVVRTGTGKRAAIDGYDVAGKTGTARKPLPTGGYQDGAGNYHYVATYAGFVPAQNPGLSVIVVVDEPSASIFAGAVSAPVFAELARYGLRLYRIPPPAAALTLSVPETTAADGDDTANEVPGGRVVPPPSTSTTTGATSTTTAVG